MLSKTEKRKHYDRVALKRDQWKRRNQYYHDDIERLLTFLIPKGHSVFDVGCGTGDILPYLQPSKGVGVDFSENMIREARAKYPKERYHNLDFFVDDIERLQLEGTFDYIVLSDLIGDLTDISVAFRNLQKVTKPDSRVIITYFNALWEPLLHLGERLQLKMPQGYQNWLSLADIENFLILNGFEVVKKGYRLLMPKKIPFISAFLNRFIAKLPKVWKLCLVTYLVARPRKKNISHEREYSVSVIVPCRNEKGNIRPAIERLPKMGSHTELIFVDGKSNDGTVEEIQKLIEEYRGEKDIKLIHQVEPDSTDGANNKRMLQLGKGDAVHKGFAAASGDILLILDADLTVPPEDLPKFYNALSEGQGEFINGSRLVYPMEKEAMRFLNKLGNKFFSLLFTWLLDQRIKDTLCGTKALFKKDYKKIAAERSFFGDFDPFGDFDFLFGAAKQNLKIIEVPIHYKERTYGDIKIERFRHGLLLLKMSGIALIKFKLI